MTLWHRFLGRYDNEGRFHFGLGERERYEQVKREDFLGHEVEMAVCERRTKRTLPQNSFVHVLARALAKDTGATEEDMKRQAVVQALGLEKGCEVFEVAGRTLVAVRGTSSLSKDECSKVCEWFLDKLAFCGIPAPKPEHSEVME